MKTKKCRPVLVECSRKSRKGDLVISPTGLGIHISDIEYSVHNKQQLILISLEDEKIEVGDLVYDTLKNRLFNAKSNYDGMEYIHKVIAIQDQLSPEYIAKFVEQYNNGKVDVIEIEMEEFCDEQTIASASGFSLKVPINIEYKPKLINGFVTIVEKELIHFPYKIEKDKIILYGAGKFRDESLTLDKSKIAILFVELYKFLHFDKEPILYTEEEVLQLLYKWSVYKVNIVLDKLADELSNVLPYDEWFEQNKKK